MDNHRSGERRLHKRSDSPYNEHRSKKAKNSASPVNRSDYKSKYYFEDDRIGKPIHQAEARSPIPNRRSPSRHVHQDESPPRIRFEYSLRIGNLNYQFNERRTHAALMEEFKKYGLVDVKVLGFHKDRHAYVNFTKEEEARRARRQLQDKLLFGRPMRIEFSKSTILNKFSPQKPSVSFNKPNLSSRHVVDVPSRHHFDNRDSPSSVNHLRRSLSSKGASFDEPSFSRKGVVDTDPSVTRTLFVGNLDNKVTEGELQDVFGRYGQIENVDIKCPLNGSTAYAFVKYINIKDAIAAKEEMQDRFWGRHRLRVGYGKGFPVSRIWVGNLGGLDDMVEVEHHCDRYGVVKRVDYKDGDDHGFVHFVDHDAALIAVQSMKNLSLKSGNFLKIELAKSFVEQDDYVSFTDFVSRESTREGFGREERSIHSPSHSRKIIFDQHSPVRDLRAHINSTRHVRVRSEGNLNDEKVNGRHRSRGNGFAQEHHHHRHHDQQNREDRSILGMPPTAKYKHSTHSSKQWNKNEDQSRQPFRKSQRKSQDNGERSSRSHHQSEEKPGNKVRPSKLSSTNDNNKKKSPKDDLANVAYADITEPSSPDSDNLVKDLKQESNPLLEAESLVDFAKGFPVAWKGNLLLKNTAFPARMHLIGGDPAIAELLVKANEDIAVLKITQRLRLEPSRLDEVNKRIQSAGPKGHCLLLALPLAIPNPSTSQEESDSAQFRPLKTLVSYLKQKEAAGIVSLGDSSQSVELSVNEAGAVSQDSVNVGMLHAFPPCGFSLDLLKKVAPNLDSEASKDEHIVAVVMKGAA